MARAQARTKLPLDEWARLMGLHPLHFNGVQQPNVDANRTALCKRVWYQHDWQDADRVGREEVAEAIASAERRIETFLGYRLLPTWEVEDWRATATANRAETFFLTPFGVNGSGRTVKATWGMFISGGVEAVSQLEDAATVTYTDRDGDGYAEEATCSLTVASSVLADASELEVHVTDAHEVGEYDESHRVRPIRVKVTDNGNGTYTFDVRMRREQLVKPDLISILPSFPGLNGGDDANFVATVELWRRYNDPSQQATIMWERPSDCATCGSAGCTNCQYGTQAACLMARGDPRLSMLAYSPATWNAGLYFDAAPWSVGREPDVVRLFYRAGMRDRSRESTLGGRRFGAYHPNQVLDDETARAVARYAASLLDRPVCDCGGAQAALGHWSADLAYSGGAEQLSAYQISQKDLDNPFGTRAGAVAAWKHVREPGAALGRAALI